jgi:hypothetical protein
MSGRSANAYFRISSAPTAPREPAASLENAINDRSDETFFAPFGTLNHAGSAFDSRVLSEEFGGRPLHARRSGLHVRVHAAGVGLEVYFEHVAVRIKISFPLTLFMKPYLALLRGNIGEGDFAG